MLAFFPATDYITAQVPQRIAFGIADSGGGLSSKGPADLTMRITGDHEPRTVDVRGHRRDLPWAYYPIDFTPGRAGQYTVATKVDGEDVSATFTVGAKGSSDVPGPTQTLPAMKTPTTTDPLGVDPICTQDPPCPFHSVSLDTALGRNKPVAYLVATPKFCQTGICGPVLDVLVSTAKHYPDQVTFIHQEVYQSATEAAEKGAGATLTDAVQQLHLTSEPVLFVTGRNGVITHRLDSAFDQDELSRSLDGALA